MILAMSVSVYRDASLLHRSQLLLLFLPIFRFFGVFASNFVVFFRNMLFGCSSLIKLLQIILYIESATFFTRQCFGVCTDTSKHTWIAFTQYKIFYKRCRFNFVHIVRSLSSLFIIYFFLFRTFRLFLQPLPLLRSRYLCVCVFFLFIYILFSSFFSLPLFLFFCSLPTKLYAYIYTARTNTHTHIHVEIHWQKHWQRVLCTHIVQMEKSRADVELGRLFHFMLLIYIIFYIQLGFFSLPLSLSLSALWLCFALLSFELRYGFNTVNL